MTVSDWLSDATTQLKAAGIATARLDADLILAHVLNKNRTWLLAHPDQIVTADEQADELLHQRLLRTPLAYLTGSKEFYGRDFIVTPDVLIPRPESEMIVHVLKELPLAESPTIHDVGTGSGSLAITIALELPMSTVIGSDISMDAIVIARKNAKQIGVKNVSFRVDDLLFNQHGPYDAIVANLPYVDPEWQRSPETDHEPALALFADEHGLKLIKDSIQQAADRLAKRGYLLLEADPEQHAIIIGFAAQHGLTHVRTDDYVVTLQHSSITAG